MYEVSDREIISQFNSGNYENFSQLINRYSEKAFRTAIRLLKNRSDAEDVLQDVFLTIYDKSKSFENRSSFSSWLYRITVNACLMKLRTRKTNQAKIEKVVSFLHTGFLEGKTIPKNYSSEYQVFRKELTEIVFSNISSLPKNYRKVFLLRDVEGQSTQDTANILNISEAAVKSRLHRARNVLREMLKDFYENYKNNFISEIETKTAVNY